MIGVIGGSGFYSFFTSPTRNITVTTPYGDPSGPITIGEVQGKQVAFLARHGHNHHYSPHTIPYQANMWALSSIGVDRVLAPCAVGSLQSHLLPGMIVAPDQLIDRTQGRADTFFPHGGIHVNFADPYCMHLRHTMVELPQIHDGGTMVVIQGPRFSTRAESSWFSRSGFHLVNMTGYPEAVLARELEMCYAPLALITDHDAGVEQGQGVCTKDVLGQFHQHVHRLKQLIETIISMLPERRSCQQCLAHTGVELPFTLPYKSMSLD